MQNKTHSTLIYLKVKSYYWCGECAQNVICIPKWKESSPIVLHYATLCSYRAIKLSQYSSISKSRVAHFEKGCSAGLKERIGLVLVKVLLNIIHHLVQITLQNSCHDSSYHGEVSVILHALNNFCLPFVWQVHNARLTNLSTSSLVVASVQTRTSDRFGKGCSMSFIYIDIAVRNISCSPQITRLGRPWRSPGSLLRQIGLSMLRFERVSPSKPMLKWSRRSIILNKKKKHSVTNHQIYHKEAERKFSNNSKNK